MIKNLTLKPVSNQPDKQAFKNPELSFTITSRDIESSLGVIEYIKLLFPFINSSQVTSLFGFTRDFSPLYGGRIYNQKNTMTKQHLTEMEQLGISLSLNLTNHFFNEKAYQETLPLLEKHHRQGNFITCFNDQLAERLRKDFPYYTLKASIIKNLNTVRKVKNALQLYDDVVIPMDKNDDEEFLISLPQKHRIILFSNATCAYTCPNRSCYVGFSQQIQGKKFTSDCSIPKQPREQIGMMFFDTQGLYELGYRKMKLLTPFNQQKTQKLKNQFQNHKSWHIFQRAEQNNKLTSIVSYPKAGRTWLRYFLACYVNQIKQLDMDINFASMFSLFPNDTNEPDTGRAAFNTQLRHNIPLIQFSHKLYTKEQAYSKTLMIQRSIPDTLISEYFHFTRHLKSDNTAIEEYLFKSEQQGVFRLCHYLNAWAEQPEGDHCLTITYEGLHKEPEQNFATILRFLNIDIDQTILKAAIKQASFDSMASQEAQKPIPNIQYNYQNIESRRVRKGRVNAHQAYLDEATIQKIQHICDKILTSKAKQRLTEHGLCLKS